MFAEFKGFLLKTNALALAVGVIIGAALGNVVKSLVDDIIMPPIGLLLGGVDFSALKVVLKAADPSDPATEVAIRYGTFINIVIAFVVVAFVVFLISKLFIKQEAPAQPPALKDCPYCLTAIPLNARRCPSCTSDLTAPVPEKVRVGGAE
jgi:large conductance mechanosensitive channel